MGPAGIAALTALITSGVQAGTGALESRRQGKIEKKRAGLQDVLQALNPQTQGQQPVRQGQGWGQLGNTMADPLVQKGIADLINKVVNPSQKRTNLPDASQALTGGGLFGAAGSGVPGAARRPSAASRAPAAVGPSLGATGAAGATAWTWPNGQPVTLQQVNDPSISMAIRQTWRRNTSLPSGTRRPTGTQPYQQGGLLDPLLSRLRG
jgi:hypothetical protein